MFYFLYLYLTRVSLDVFNCNPPEPSDGFTYMEASPSIKCGSTLHTQLMIGAAITTVVYSFGYPALVGFVLFKYRFTVKEDQLLRAMKTGDNRLTNANCYNFRKTFHKIYYHFKPDKFYWNLLIIARKFIIAFAALMFRDNPAFQLAIALLVMFFSYALQVRHNPYMCPKKFNKIIDEYEMRANVGDNKAKELLTRARKSAQGSEGRHIRAKRDLTGVFVFDYNQVESVLLMSGTLVTLSGVMFQSQYLDSSDYDVQRETLTMIVLTIILASIIYYCLVFVTEIWGTCRSTKKKRTLTKREKVEEALQVMKDFELKQETGEGGALAMNPMFAAQREVLEKASDPKNALLSNSKANELQTLASSNRQLIQANKQLRRRMQELQEEMQIAQNASGNSNDNGPSGGFVNPAFEAMNPNTKQPSAILSPASQRRNKRLNTNNTGRDSTAAANRREKLLARSNRNKSSRRGGMGNSAMSLGGRKTGMSSNSLQRSFRQKQQNMQQQQQQQQPQQQQANIPVAVAVAAPVQNSNNGGWTKHMDEEYNVPYYYNPSTGESTYDTPADYME
eukprot:TRINITY_DN323_c1_g1_i2.p1 TRINITY_DN323_c1_g1~~TRINITY_DN323_c1_g1_i2.p1  ORF type:complete len:639 (+),score=220.11 TRINITY_DN323_c1_g1_i2:231-1919(+)